MSESLFLSFRVLPNILLIRVAMVLEIFEICGGRVGLILSRSRSRVLYVGGGVLYVGGGVLINCLSILDSAELN